MPDLNERPDEQNEDALAEIQELLVEPHPELEGRIQRDINRRTLVADSLDFSFVVMLQTFWDYLRGLIEAWPAKRTEENEK